MRVVGAVLVRDGRVLAGLRPGRGWEFPGGKVEPGETDAQALARECREELALDVMPVRELGGASSGAIELRLWLAEASGPVTGSADHDELRWFAAGELDAVEWLPLDRELLPLIRALL